MAASSIDGLVAFAAVFDSRSFTAAAQRLAITTNAVSLRVRKLEAALGVRLFTRTTRSVTATDEGRRFRETAAAVIGKLEQGEEDLQPAGSALRGTVRISMPGALATAPFLDRVRALLEGHPELAIHARVTDAPVMNLAAEGLDVALVVGQPPSSTFVGRLLGRVTWVLVASPSYLKTHRPPRKPEDLAGHRCLRLLSNPPQAEWTLIDRLGRELTVRVGGGFEADDSRALGEAAYAGLGIGVRPAGECASAAKNGRLRRVLPGYRFQPLEVYALLPKGRLKIPRVAACVEALRAAVGELS